MAGRTLLFEALDDTSSLRHYFCLDDSETIYKINCNKTGVRKISDF